MGNAALIGFRYMLIAGERGYPQPQPSQLCLAGVSLYRWKIANIRLRNADFSNAHLSETTWENVSWEGGSLARAFLTQSHWKNCCLTNIATDEMDSSSAVFRNSTIHGMPNVEGWRSACTGTDNSACQLNNASLSQILDGHQNWVRSVVYDGDRGRYVSGSYDETLKVWDAETHQCIATLEGHQDVVRSVVYDGDRGRYISGSYDKTVKVWDAETHQCIATLEGHQDVVRSVVYDGDRGRYISGSYDKTVKVWDAETHQCIATHLLLPENQWAAFETQRPRDVVRSENAGEHLKWVGTEVESGKLIAIPFEGLL